MWQWLGCQQQNLSLVGGGDNHGLFQTQHKVSCCLMSLNTSRVMVASILGMWGRVSEAELMLCVWKENYEMQCSK